MTDERASAAVVFRLVAWAARPLSFYRTLAWVAICAAVVQTIRTGTIFWEGFTAAATIAAVVRLLAHVQGRRLPPGARA